MFSVIVKTLLLVRICMDAIKKVLFVISLFLICSCNVEDNEIPSEVIPFCGYDRVELCQFYEQNGADIRYVILKAPDKKYMFSSIDKILVKDSHMYIFDWLGRKILVFDENGIPVKVLSKRGRGSGEYLQITDFDVDEHGNIWILDGQKDVFMKYDSNLSHVESMKLPWEVHAVKCLNEGFMFGLTAWDQSSHKGNKILVTDQDMNVKSSFLKYPEDFDENYAFPSSIFNVSNDGYLYHQPVDDCVYHINDEGCLDYVYKFDFGSRSVPSEISSDIERHREKFSNYTALINSVYVGNDYIAGTVVEDCIKDFVIDRKNDKLYVSTGKDTPRIVGIVSGKLIWRITSADSDMSESLPSEVKSSVQQGEEILAILDLEK